MVSLGALSNPLKACSVTTSTLTPDPARKMTAVIFLGLMTGSAVVKNLESAQFSLV